MLIQYVRCTNETYWLWWAIYYTFVSFSGGRIEFKLSWLWGKFDVDSRTNQWGSRSLQDSDQALCITKLLCTMIGFDWSLRYLDQPTPNTRRSRLTFDLHRFCIVCMFTRAYLFELPYKLCDSGKMLLSYRAAYNYDVCRSDRCSIRGDLILMWVSAMSISPFYRVTFLVHSYALSRPYKA